MAKLECDKCKYSISEDSKFCPNCGKEIEKEKPLYIQAEDNLKLCSKLWYIIGFLKGSSLNDKKDALDDFKKIIKKDRSGMWEWYQEVVNYWRDFAINNDKELKEKVRLERASISEVKRMQKKK